MYKKWTVDSTTLHKMTESLHNLQMLFNFMLSVDIVSCCSFHCCAPSFQAEVEASSGEQEYSADFESTTTASTVSVPSAPSTPRVTPPLEEGGAGEEVPEKEGVADDTVAVTPVATPRPTSEEEEEEEVGGVVMLSGGCGDCNICTVYAMRPCS